MDSAVSLEEGIEVATLILSVLGTNGPDNSLVYAIIIHLTQIVTRLHPRPPPDLILQFLHANQARIRFAASRGHHPIAMLVESYTRIYAQEQKTLDPSSATPSESVLDRLESLRLQHLVAIRTIQRAMEENEDDLFNIRSYASLMSAYNRGGSFQDVERIWEVMRKEGGVGIDARTVAVVSPFRPS